MWYAILCEDVENSLVKRQQHRPAHLARLEILQSEARLLVAGPHPIETADSDESSGYSGSLIIAEFNSLEAAQAWAELDPFYINGVYGKVTVKPFKKVLGFSRG